MTGASVTNKGVFFAHYDSVNLTRRSQGIYYETGKEPPVEGPPKLHLLIESNEEYRVSLSTFDTLGISSKDFFRWSKRYGRSNVY
jgi:hypothetical protein